MHIQLVRCLEHLSVHSTEPVSGPDAETLERAGFEVHSDDGLHFMLVQDFAELEDLGEVLSAAGLVATIRDCSDEQPCGYCVAEFEAAYQHQVLAALPGTFEQLNAVIQTLQNRIEFLERRTVWLAGNQHPDAAFRVLVQAPPAVLVHDKRQVFLDVIRKRPVAATPEEGVRQRVLVHLMDYLGYTPASLASEWPMKREFRDTADRADIVVMWPKEVGDGYEYAAVIECKRPGSPLTDTVWEQVTRYGARLKARVLALTDGDQIVVRVRGHGDVYRPVDGFPTFHALRSGQVPPAVFARPRGRPRPEFDALSTPETYEIFDDVVYEGLDERVAIPCLNIASLLLDETDAPVPTPLEAGWALEQDRGLLDVSFTNAGYSDRPYRGLYRGFVLRAADGNTVLPFLRINLSQYAENSAATPHLAVGLHHLENSKKNHALQLNLLKGVKHAGNRIVLTHHGRLGLGEGGAVAGARTLAFLASVAPDLVQGGQIVLGSLPNDRLIQWTDFLPVLGRLVRYVVACEALRDSVRGEKRSG